MSFCQSSFGTLMFKEKKMLITHVVRRFGAGLASSALCEMRLRTVSAPECDNSDVRFDPPSKRMKTK